VNIIPLSRGYKNPSLALREHLRQTAFLEDLKFPGMITGIPMRDLNNLATISNNYPFKTESMSLFKMAFLSSSSSGKFSSIVFSLFSLN